MSCLALGSGEDEIDLPRSIKNLTNLTSLSLCGNFTKKSLELILDLPITFLKIVYNQRLTSLPDDFFFRLKHLQHFELNNVDNLVFSEAEREFALNLREPYYVYESRLHPEWTNEKDVGCGFVYFSFNPNNRYGYGIDNSDGEEG